MVAAAQARLTHAGRIFVILSGQCRSFTLFLWTQFGEAALQDLPALLNRLVGKILRRVFLRGLWEVHHNGGLSELGILVRFELRMRCPEKALNQDFGLLIKTRERSGIERLMTQGFEFMDLCLKGVRSRIRFGARVD